MSLELSNSQPRVIVKTGFDPNPVLLYEDKTRLPRGEPGINLEIPMDDFCELVKYVLTNNELAENDPRLPMVEFVRKLKVVPGYNYGNYRLATVPEPEKN